MTLHHLSDSEALALIRVASVSGCSGKRIAACLALMYYCGLRVSEVCYLRTGSVDTRRRVVTVPPEGKTGERSVSIPSPAVPYLEAWEAIRPTYAARSTEPPQWYVLSKRGRRMDRRDVWAAMRRYARKCGLLTGNPRERVHPHALRHSYACKVLNATGATVADVQYALGHKDIRTTMVYLHADPVRHKRVIEAAFEEPPQ